MKKRIISIFLILCISILLSVPALGAMSLSNFEKIRTYNGQFTDVSASAWYYESVCNAYEYGLANGKSSSVFDPGGAITLAESMRFAAVLHKGYYTGSIEFEQGSPWYSPYVDYLRNNGVPVSAYRNLNANATRADFALIIASAVPDEALTPVNRIYDGAIPDVFESYSYGQAVYKLYRAGVMSGSDSTGTFFPGRTITRAEVAAIIMRVVNADSRVFLSLAAELTGEQIYRKASPAVFFIEIYDDADNRIKTGSGFFISESGIAITNYHVTIGASSAKVTLSDGRVMNVTGVYDYDWKKDAAIIQVEGRNFPYLDMADSSKLSTGATVYALGSPLGLQASFSRGIVSQSLREIEGANYIQLDAAISSGSSGGALLDTAGRVVGVTSATMLNAQNINLAVPINVFNEMSYTHHVPLRSMLIRTDYYDGFFPAPDFGAFFDVEPFDVDTSGNRVSYAYRINTLPRGVETILDEYEHLIQQNLFVHVSNLTTGGNTFKVYYNSRYNVNITLGTDVIRGQNCVMVLVS